MESSAEQPRRHIACGICRRRKLKCDGRKPTCSTCQRLGQICEYTEVVRKAGPKRGYVRSLETRLAQLEKLLNDYHLDLDDSTVRRSDDLISLNLEEPLPPRELVKELSDHFFNTFNMILPVIDRRRYMLALGLDLRRQPQPFLQYAILATAAADSPQFRSLKPTFYQRARKYISRAEMFRSTDGAPSIAYIQALGLLAHLEVREGLFPQAWVAVGKAYRACSMLSLHLMDADKWQGSFQDSVELAECRRAFWFIFFCDRAGSIATSLPGLFNRDDLLVKLPLDDEAFSQGNYNTDCIALEDIYRQPTTMAKYPNARLAMTIAIIDTNYTILDLGKFPKHKYISNPKDWFTEYQRWDGILAQLTATLAPVPQVSADPGDESNKVLLEQKYRRTSYVLIHLWAQVGVLLLCRSGLHGLHALPVLLPLFNAGKLLQRALMGMLEIMLITRNPHDLSTIGAHPAHPILLFAICVLILALSEHGLITIESFQAPLEYIAETLANLSDAQPVTAKLAMFLDRVMPRNEESQNNGIRRVEDVLVNSGVHLSLPNFFDQWMDPVQAQNTDSQDPSIARRLSSVQKPQFSDGSNRPRAPSSASMSSSGSSNGPMRSPMESPQDYLQLNDFASAIDNAKLQDTEQGVPTAPQRRPEARSPRKSVHSPSSAGLSSQRARSFSDRADPSAAPPAKNEAGPAQVPVYRNGSVHSPPARGSHTTPDMMSMAGHNRGGSFHGPPSVESTTHEMHRSQSHLTTDEPVPGLMGLHNGTGSTVELELSPSTLEDDPPLILPDESMFDYEPAVYMEASTKDIGGGYSLDANSVVYGADEPWLAHSGFDMDHLGGHGSPWPTDAL